MTARTGAQTYFLYDGLGSTANLTNAAGTTTATYSYDVFGALRSPSPSSKNEFRFTGEQRDPQGNRNFYYLRARYYDPAIGRFLSRDPVACLSQSLEAWHAYAYAENNPTTFVDLSGLSPTPTPPPRPQPGPRPTLPPIPTKTPVPTPPPGEPPDQETLCKGGCGRSCLSSASCTSFCNTWLPPN